MSESAYFATVAVEGLVYHFDAPYSYKVPLELEAQALPGCRVMVPFGNGNRKKQGLILSVKPLFEADNSVRLKSIHSVIDDEPLFTEEMLSLVTWLKENTFCTLFEAAKAMLPAGIGLNYVVTYMADKISDEDYNKLSFDEKRVFDYLKDGCKFVKQEKILSDLDLPADSKILEKLVNENTKCKRR